MFERLVVMFRKAGLIGTLAGSLWMAMTAAALADMSAIPTNASKELRQIETSIGYRGTSISGSGQRAKEYDSLQSSPTFNLLYLEGNETLETFLDFHFLNDNDYYMQADLNLRSKLRFNFFNERLYHNLDHFPYDADSTSEAPPDGVFRGETLVDYSDQDPSQDFHLRIDQTEAALRYKIPDYPAHVNLKYWRWEKKGLRQQRFLDENCTSCHMQSRNQRIDMVTEEVTAGFDAHLGLVDLIFEQVVRCFDNREAAPVDFFAGNDLLAAGEYQHDETPDSRFTQSTLKAHSTLGGGFVANASASVGKRDNESSLDDVYPVEAETDFTKLASDVTYIPSSKWTLNLRYRMLDLDQSNVSSIGGAGYQEYDRPGTTPTFMVRNNIDIERNYYEASISYRPGTHLTLKGNYHREDIHRNNTNGPVRHDGSLNIQDPYWELPEDETIQKARLTVSSRLFAKNALKLQGWYEYQTSDDPAYSISIEKGHTLFASATYRNSPLWGGAASFRYRDLKNNGFRTSQFDEADSPVYFDKDRSQRQQNASVGFWLVPLQGLSFDTNYGYLKTHIEQDLLYGRSSPTYSIKDGTDFDQTVHTLSAGASWQVSEQFGCRLEGYHIRSKADYSPDFPTENLPLGIASAEDLKAISRLDIRQYGIKGRLNWQFYGNWSASLELTLDDYDDRDSNLFDGTVETCMVSLSTSW